MGTMRLVRASALEPTENNPRMGMRTSARIRENQYTGIPDGASVRCHVYRIIIESIPFRGAPGLSGFSIAVFASPTHSRQIKPSNILPYQPQLAPMMVVKLISILKSKQDVRPKTIFPALHPALMIQ